MLRLNKILDKDYCAEELPHSEFLQLVSRGKLKHPPIELFDLSQYLYTFLKLRPQKCCNKVFLQAFQNIYDATDYNLKISQASYEDSQTVFFQSIC